MEEELIKEQKVLAEKAEELYKEGKRLLAEKDFDKAYDCFRKSYKMYPRNYTVCFKLFVQSIRDMKYDEAFEYFETLFATSNPYSKMDNNFYLYLLNVITEVPDRYKEYVKRLTIDDIKVSIHDSRYQDASMQNKIRISAMQGKLSYAIYLLNQLSNRGDVYSTQLLITKTLLRQAIDVERKNKDTLMELIKNKRYKEIVEFLENKKEKQNLNANDKYILRITEQIIEIQYTNKVPEKTICMSECINEAIEAHDYDLALSICKGYDYKYNINDEDNMVYLLLMDICDLTSKMTLNEEQIEIVDTKEEVSKEEMSRKEEDTSLENIIGYLVNNDLDNMFSRLSVYLSSINKEKYEFLITSLIKISLIEKDMAFTKPILSLIDISKDTYNFDITKYIQQFYITLAQNKLDEAKIYLSIIERLHDLVDTKISINDLLQALKNAEGKQDDKTDMTDSSIDEVSMETELKEVMSTETIGQENTLPKRDSTIEFIERNHKLLVENHGIIILKPMNEERRRVIYNIVNKYPDMTSFSIGAEPNKQLVLRYRKISNECVDIKKLIEDSKLYYRNGNYKKCIETNLQILQTNSPSAITYSRIGMSYLKLGNIDEAITYLTVATYVSVAQGGNLDYTDFVNVLKNKISKADKKPYFKMSMSDFKDDLQENYGIKNLDQITAYIFENDLDIETVCSEFGVPIEQIDVIKLIFAKKYYSQGNYEMGDTFVKSVERSKDKTPFVLKLFNEVRTNKRFYINRVVDDTKPLKLTLKPDSNS